MKRATWGVSVCVVIATILLASCSGGNSIKITFPGGATLAIDQNQSVTINATVTGDSTNAGVTWSCSGAACGNTSLGNETATSVTFTANGATGTATITATSAKQSTISGTVTITVTAPPSITTASLPNGIMGTAYSGGTITETGGAGSLTYSVSVGGLPAGLTLNGSTGAITGTPTGPASTTPVSFTIKVTDSSAANPQSVSKALSITISQAPGITSANKTTFVVSTSGSFTVTATGVPTPALTESGPLPSGLTFVDNGNGTGTLNGTPAAGTAANYAITFTANNGVGTAATQNFTLTVGQAPAITSPNNTAFTVGTLGTFNVTTSGFPAPSLSESGALPSGVTFKDNGNGTATLSGTPAAGTGAKYTLTITASNGVGSNGTQTFTLTVDQTPAITSASSTSFVVNTAGTFQVTASGYPTPSIAESGALPTGVAFVDNGNGTGTLSGIPTTTGNYAITFTPSNGVGSPAAQNFTLTVGQAPAITSSNKTTFTTGTLGSFTVTTSGFPKPSLNETGALPSGVSFKDNGDGTATLSGTPGATAGGVYTITITASNGVGSNATQTFTLTVDQAPAITSANNTTFSVGGAGSFAVTATGYPSPSITESGALPSGVTFTGGTGSATLSGTPASGTNGAYTITFTASNGVGSNFAQTFTLTVDTAPIFTSANATTFTVNSAGSFNVTASGTPAPTITESGTLPSGVTFTSGTGSATLAGTPAAGTGGVYSVTFTASNGVGTNGTQTFTLTVDQAPAITSTNTTTFTESAFGSFTVMTSGYPKNPGMTITETGSLPSGITLKDNGDGTATLSGTPASGTASGSPYTITITASNGVTPNGTQTFTLNVNSAPVFTTANNTTFTVGTNGSFTMTATGNPSPAISETGTLPGGVSFNGGTGSATLSGTPATGSGGVYNITIKATSSSGTTSQSFTLTVDEAPGFTSVANATFNLSGNNSFNVTTSGYPKNPGMTIVEAGPLPIGVSFKDNGDGTGALSGTPTTTTGSPWTITFTASNGIGTPANQTFTLTIVNDPCSSAGTGGESLLSGSYAFLLKGFDNGTGSGETQPEPALVGGVLTFNGTNNNGQITAGTIDMNLNGSKGITTFTVSSGTYKIGASGSADQQRVCMDVTTNAGTQRYRASINSAGSIGHMIGFDSSGPFVTGEMKKQNSTIPTTLSGNFVFGVSSAQNSVQGGGKFGAIGVLDLASGGAVNGGDVDFNDGSGNLDQVSGCADFSTCGPVTVMSGAANGSYSISANGRGTLSFTPGGSQVHTMVYVVSSSDIFILGSDDQTVDNAFAGEALQQSGSLALSGNYVGATSRQGSTAGDSRVSLFRGTFSSGNATNFTQYKNDSGTVSVKTGASGTYTINSTTGRMLPNIGGTGPVLYLVSSSQAFFLDNSTNVESGSFQSQTSTTAPSSVSAYGTINPETSNVSEQDGVASFSAGNVNITQDTNTASNPQQAGKTQSQTLSVDGTGFGAVPSGCTPSTSGSCQFVFYVISSTSAVGTDFGSSDPAIQPLDH